MGPEHVNGDPGLGRGIGRVGVAVSLENLLGQGKLL